MRLGDIAEIISGHPFRSKIKDQKDGDTLVVQMKDVSDTGLSWLDVVATKIEKARESRYLQTNDILIVARGNRNSTVLIEDTPKPAVCSPHFFIIRTRPNSNIEPAFLSWYLAQKPSQQYLERNAQGTSIRSVRRETIEDMPLPTVAYEKQLSLAKLAQTITDHQLALEQLIENDQQLMNHIARSL